MVGIGLDQLVEPCLCPEPHQEHALRCRPGHIQSHARGKPFQASEIHVHGQIGFAGAGEGGDLLALAEGAEAVARRRIGGAVVNEQRAHRRGAGEEVCNQQVEADLDLDRL